MPLLSVIVPCFNEEAALPHFYTEAVSALAEIGGGVQAEFVFVDDGSMDGTMRVIKGLRAQDRRVRYISFSRNFGKEAAIFAGLKECVGDFATLMDADLQDPPALLKDMYAALTREGCDCAAARRVNRKGEPPIRSLFARVFYRVINKISQTEIVDGARDFRMMTRKYVNSVCEISEYNRFSKGIFSWVGFKTKWLEYENAPRVAGNTKWSFWKLFKYSLDGILAYSTVPLYISSAVGLLCFVASLIMILFYFIKTLIWGDPVAGYPSLICFILMIGGIQLFSIGVLGQYLAKTYLETKRRPAYIVSERESDSVDGEQRTENS
ncbi:MAG: glycosyltransferase family 2 protein [Oscillospiraceae bacterium]|jgi:glycosyltransferase involved in cell wall biosynthesis|nr:glycosyltransferase family 2 protein [Oscillospiraceae bacterium]